MYTLYVLVGGNIGDRLNNLGVARSWLQKEIGQVTRSSAIYETQAWGDNDQPDFYNQIHTINTQLQANEVMQKILGIEEKMGRVRTIKNAARIIDIDILFFDQEIININGLTVPHPEIANRRFVLVPFDELSPNFVHPLFHKTIHELLSICKDGLEVRPVFTS